MGRALRVSSLCLAVVMAISCRNVRPVIDTLDDAMEAQIGVMVGSLGETIGKSRFPDAELKSFDDVMEAVAALKAGQLDAVITSMTTSNLLVKKNPDLRMLPERLLEEGTSVAVAKGNPALVAQINAILAEFQADGTLASLKRRWFKPELGPYEELQITPVTVGEPLRVGVAATREPFSFIDSNGQVSGHDGELARLIAVKLQRPIVFSDMKFSALIPSLQVGKIDAIITGMTATAERGKSVAFSDSYFANGQILLVRQPPSVSTPSSTTASAGLGKMATAADLHGRRIGVMMGTAHETFATKTYPDATILQFQSSPDLLLSVKSGKVDVGLEDTEALRTVMREEASIGIVGETLFSFPVGAGFRTDNQALTSQFNAFLADIRATGVHADMVRRWVDSASTVMPDLPTSATTGVLTVGISSATLPFLALKNDTLVGFDIELTRRFAASLGKSVTFSDMQFGSLIAAVSSGKVDMIVSSIFITDERKLRIAFSNPYFETGTKAFALTANIAGASGTPATAPAAATFLERLTSSIRSNILVENRWRLLVDGLTTTVVISLLSTAFGTVLGALVCFARMSPNRVLRTTATLYIALLRGTPVLVLLMLIFYVVFAAVNISPVLVAVVAFGMNFAAYVAEIFRAGVSSIDAGQTEAGIAMGFTKARTFQYIVLPQTVQRILPNYKGEFISLVKMTSIVGYIAVQDLKKASDIIRSRTFDAFFPLVMVAVLYFGISWVLMQGLEYLERLTDPKHTRRGARRA